MGCLKHTYYFNKRTDILTLGSMSTPSEFLTQEVIISLIHKPVPPIPWAIQKNNLFKLFMMQVYIPYIVNENRCQLEEYKYLVNV